MTTHGPRRHGRGRGAHHRAAGHREPGSGKEAADARTHARHGVIIDGDESGRLKATARAEPGAKAKLGAGGRRAVRALRHCCDRARRARRSLRGGGGAHMSVAM